jgi:hypothetical protein
MDIAPDDNAGRSRNFARPFVEFAVVGGASLIAIAWVIPAETVARENFGLSPRMVPTVCAAVIFAIAAINLLVSLVRPQAGPAAQPAAGLGTVLALVAAAIAGVAAVHYFGLIAGGVAVCLLVSLVLGERRPLHLCAIGASAAALLYAVIWLGL